MEYIYIGYIQLIFLLIFYLILMVFSILISRKFILTPEFIFLVGFVPQFSLALLYVKKWDLVLSVSTFLVYILGAFSFSFFSIVLGDIIKRTNQISKHKTTYIRLSKTKLMVAIIIQLASIIIMSKTLMNITERNTIQSAINVYTINSKATGMRVPSIPGKLNLLSYVSGYVWIYYIMHAVVYKYKAPYALLLINFVLSTISNLLTGSRGGVVQTIFVGVVLFYIFMCEKNNWKNELKPKYIMIVIIAGIIILITFKSSLDLLGRSSSVTSFSDYFAHYLCAEIKNLDVLISSGAMKFRWITEWETLNRLITSTLGHLGLNIERKYADESTYLVYGGIQMGNVYTIYASFVKDLHLFGIFFFEAIMALICRIAFKHAIYDKPRDGLEFGKLIYAYIVIKLLFAFFSNWFYNDIVSLSFMWSLLFWFITFNFVEKKHIIIRRRRYLCNEK